VLSWRYAAEMDTPETRYTRRHLTANNDRFDSKILNMIH